MTRETPPLRGTPTSQGHCSNVRWFIAGISCLGFLSALATVIWLYAHSDPVSLGSQRVNDQTDLAVEIRLSLSTVLFQLGVVITGALWGLLLGKKDEVRIVWRDRQEILAFVSANCLLLTSFWAHYLYSAHISDAYFLAGQTLEPGVSDVTMPNVIDSAVANLYICQVVSLFVGVCVSVTTFLSAHWLRGENE